MRAPDAALRDTSAREFLLGAACGLVLLYGMKALRIWPTR